MKLVYFAWIRERIGRSEEDIEIPDTIGTVGELINYLKDLDENYQRALEPSDIIGVAIDQQHVEHDAKIAGAKEIAIFPPMTGG